MASYVASTEKWPGPPSTRLDGFRGEWVGDEALKWAFIDEHPEAAPAVHEIRQSPPVRGRMMAFDPRPHELVCASSGVHSSERFKAP